jgi:endonuclease G
MKKFLLSLFFIFPFILLSQKVLRDSVIVNTDIFKIVYSEKLQQPLSAKYMVQCPSGTASRKGLDFYTCDSIITSDKNDYNNNVWDKGHMAPAADFNCSRDLIKKTFTYINCTLQHQDLNRTTWKLLEEHERLLALKYKIVSVEIICEFSKTSKVLSSGATVPDGYYKIIKYNNITETYYFKNEKPSSTDFKKFIVKV